MRQFDASLCAANRAAVLVTCVRAGWALVGALVAASGDAPWLDARRRRLVEVWGRAIDAAGDGDALSGGYGVADGGGALDETHELVCLEAAAASVHALAQSAGAALEGPLGRDVASLLAKVAYAARGRLSRPARAHGRFRLKLVAAGLLEAYAALPPAAFEGDPRAAGRVFDWAVGLVLVAGAALPGDAPRSDVEAAFAPLPNESLALTSEFPPGVDPCFFVGHAAAGAGVGDGADVGAAAAAAAGFGRDFADALGVQCCEALDHSEREALAFLDVERGCPAARVDEPRVDAATVSYTHLTLPTKA